MKNLFYLIVITSFFISCSSNDSENIVDVNEDEIKGKWDLIDFKSDGSTTVIANGQSLTTEFNSTGKDYDFIFDFESNPNHVEATGSYTTVITQTTNGITQTFEVPTNSIDGLDSGEWSLINGKILFTSENIDQQIATTEAQIIEFEEDTMTLKISASESIEEEIQGQKATLQVRVNIYLTIKRAVNSNDDEDDSSDNGDSDNTIFNEKDIVGQWDLIEYKGSSTNTVSQIDGTLVETIASNFTAKDYDYVFNFMENPKEVTRKGSFTVITSTNTDGQIVTDETTNSSDGDEFDSWSIVDNNIIRVISDIDPTNPSDLKIIELKDGILKLEINHTITESVQGLTNKINSTFEIKLQKR